MASRAKELALLVGCHAAASKALTPETTRRILAALGTRDVDEKELQRKRVLLSAALALLAVSHRWGADTRTLMTAVLLGKYVDLFHDSFISDKAYVASWFFPVAATMWVRMPKAAGQLDTAVHPEFTSTMTRLLGFPSKADAVRFGRDPIAYYKGWGVTGHVAAGWRGFKWAFKALFTAYVVQAVAGWAMGGGGRREKKKAGAEGAAESDTKNKRTPQALLQSLRTALENTMRTCLVYQICASYSNVAYSVTGNAPHFVFSFPVMSFLMEPLGRLKTMCLYYIAHVIYTFYQYARVALTRGPGASATTAGAMRAVNEAVVSLGLPAMFLVFAAGGGVPPLFGGLEKITL